MIGKTGNITILVFTLYSILVPKEISHGHRHRWFSILATIVLHHEALDDILPLWMPCTLRVAKLDRVLEAPYSRATLSKGLY